MKKGFMLGLMFFGMLGICSQASAENIFAGKVAASNTSVISAPYGGRVDNIYVHVGDYVGEDSLIATLGTDEVYALVDGTVSGIFASEGDDAESVAERYGAVLFIEPTNRFTFDCSNEKGYSYSENRYIHIGETVYLSCTTDGSHSGVGVVTGVDEKDEKKFSVEVTEGLFYMNKKGVLLKDIPCTLNQILKCLSVNTDNNDIIYRWIELLKKYNYVTETDGIYVCKIEIYEKGLKYGWEEVEYLWKGKLESPLVLDYIINNIKNWDKLIQKEQQATLLLFEQGEDIYAHALYKETKILQYLNHSLSKKVLGYLHENANATILEIGAGTGATSNKVLSDIRENKFEEHIVYFYTDISRFFLQRAKERYKECDGKIEMHHQTLDIDEAFSSQLPSNFQADIVIAVGVLNNSVNTDKCIYEINSVMKPGGILLVIETVEDVPDILITQSFMMTAPKDRRKATNTMFLNRKQWLEILEENGFCNSEEFPGYGEYLEVLGQKLFYCTKE